MHYSKWRKRTHAVFKSSSPCSVVNKHTTSRASTWNLLNWQVYTYTHLGRTDYFYWWANVHSLSPPVLKQIVCWPASHAHCEIMCTFTWRGAHLLHGGTGKVHHTSLRPRRGGLMRLQLADSYIHLLQLALHLVISMVIKIETFLKTFTYCNRLSVLSNLSCFVQKK